MRAGMGIILLLLLFTQAADALTIPTTSAVVALAQMKHGSMRIFCSGTLISRDVVLTAGHCVVRSGVDVWRMKVFIGRSSAAGGKTYAVRSANVHPNYEAAPVGFIHDMALVRLASPVIGVKPISILPRSKGLSVADAGTSVVFAGFGQDAVGPRGSGVTGRRLSVLGKMGGISNPCRQSNGSIIPCLNDRANQVWYGQGRGTGGPCFGDSGGPMIVFRKGKPYVAGVTSYGDSTCGLFGVSMRVDAYEGWIRSLMPARKVRAGAGEKRRVRRCERFPAGDPCFSDGDCCSGMCKGVPGLTTCR